MTFTSDPPSGARGAEADMIINGRYAIERQLDQGGMGTIFLAKDLQAFDKRVAIKLILDQPREAQWLARFEQEARLTAQLNSPHIVNLREFGQTARGEPFIVMDFLEGENLAQHLIRHPVMPLELAVRITDEILAGLEDMHALGIIHRDIKPSNVFLQSSTSVDKRACLIDLGIAKTDQDIQSRLTAAGKIMGSFSWMAPEVIRGEPATPRADLYSVALVLLHMLGVEQPHKRPSRAGEPEAEFLIRRGGRKPLKLSSLEGSEALPVGLREALSWALSPVPERRVDSARGLRVALRRAGFAARLSPITKGQGAAPPKALLTPDAPRAYPEIIEAQSSKRDEIYQAALTRLHQRIEAQPRLRPIAAILAVVICSGLLAYFTTNGTPPPPVVLSITPPARAAAADHDAAPSPPDAAPPDAQPPKPAKRKKRHAASAAAPVTASPAKIDCHAELQAIIKQTHKVIDGQTYIIPKGAVVGQITRLFRAQRRGACSTLTAAEQAQLKAIAATIQLR